MTLDLLAPLMLFAFVSSATPGPNNMMLMSSGMTYGFLRTLPHMAGVTLGFTFMVFCVGIGLGAVFEAAPWLYDALKIFSAVYLVYLAWKIATAGPLDKGGASRGAPMTFFQAALFQWINPKAWVMGLTAIALYAPKEGFALNVLIVSLVFGAVNLPSVGAWALFGDALRHLLRDPRWVRLVNGAMALALVASLYPLLGEIGPR